MQLKSRLFKMAKSRYSSAEVAEVIRNFINGASGAWDWDDFISCKIKNSYLEQVRMRCIQVGEDYPARSKNEWCNDEGAKCLERIAEEIEKREKLLGKWELVKGDGFEQATMFIYDDGRLVYVIPQNNRDQAILLTYKLHGDVLITDQPSHPKEEKTRYEFLEDGHLKTETNGESGIWKKAELTKEDLSWKNNYKGPKRIAPKKRVIISAVGIITLGVFVFFLPPIGRVLNLMWAYKAFKDNKFSESVSRYEKIKKEDPEFGFVRWRLANAYRKNGQFKEAEHEYLWVIEKHPEHKPAYHNLGITYQQIENFPKALATYKKAVELEPDAADSWFGIGSVSLSLREIDEGIAALKRSIELNPDYELSYHLLCTALNGREKYEEALSYIEKYFSRNKATSSLLFQTAVLSAEMLKKEDVAIFYRKAGLEAFPEDYFLNWDLALEEVKTNPADAKKRLEYLKTVNKAQLNDVEQSLDLAMIEKGLRLDGQDN